MTKHQIVRADNKTPHHKVLAEIRRRDRQKGNILALLQTDWPDANKILESLCDYLTDTVRKEGVPLLYGIIEHALEEYAKLLFHSQGKKHDDPIRIARFIEALVTQTCENFKIKIASDGDTWSVDSGVSLFVWLCQHPGELTIDPYPLPNEKEVQALLFRLIACRSVKIVLQRMKNYETPLVTSNVVVGS